ncbi:sensor histidine kinase [Psychroserpens ponticola]|uniref:Histidine kinase n=1 Tax=Psychroserpens ponticola TaxID=2932268 RepID=A0ABY7S1K9_9FLAO|nr:histidine kinase [Psychroserpens ponticola]WCO03172.1 histidine kinase [Psychroserpens ponticola]
MDINKKTNNSNTKISLYWKCQLIGWSIVSVYWAYTVYTRDNYGIFYTLLNYVLDISIGIFLTHMYRQFALKAKWSSLPIKKLLIRLVPTIILLAILYVIINNLKWYVYWTFIAGEDENIWESIIYWDPILLTGLRLMSIWILAYHLYHYYQKEVVTAKENAQLSLIAKQAQLDNLSAQLNPHFLFNSLNSIKSLVIENPKVARRAIDLLSDLLRSSLYEKDKGLISIKNELALVYDYIELEKMRFEERLQLEITIDKTLNRFKIPTLSIQLLVENAIKHGIDLIVKGGIINLVIKKQQGFIEIIVTNPGKINNKKTIGLGLKNLQERLAIQYKNNADFSLTELNKNEVEAKIKIPFTVNENI